MPNCPDGKHFKMKKLLSGFSITGGNVEGENVDDELVEGEGVDPFSNLNESQSAHVMKEMERAMNRMDDENPDPRQMGSLMRRMCEITGEKMDGVMEEVVRKLEEGTNPEELEAKMEGVMSEDEIEQGSEGNTGGNATCKKTKKRILIRDPQLYELRDFLT